MATLYSQRLIDLCNKLGVDIPCNIRADQRLTIKMIDACLASMTADATVDTKDADATATDILEGKTAYVNGVKVTGALGFTALPAPTALVLPTLNMLQFEGAPVLNSLINGVEVYLGEEKLGDAVYEALTGWRYDFSAVVLAAGAITLACKYVAKAEVTLVDSAEAETIVNVVALTRALTGCADSNTAAFIVAGADVTGTLSLLEGFTTLPASITVSVGGEALTVIDDFTYDNTTGSYSIDGEGVTGEVVITAVATA